MYVPPLSTEHDICEAPNSESEGFSEPFQIDVNDDSAAAIHIAGKVVTYANVGHLNHSHSRNGVQQRPAVSVLCTNA